MEDDKVFVYHNLENSRMLHGTELQCIEVEPPVCCSVDDILHSFWIVIYCYHILALISVIFIGEEIDNAGRSYVRSCLLCGSLLPVEVMAVLFSALLLTLLTW